MDSLYEDDEDFNLSSKHHNNTEYLIKKRKKKKNFINIKTYISILLTYIDDESSSSHTSLASEHFTLNEIDE
ncbi:hypothetical protein PFNF54_04576 [Plasmodium falciparum NF54]|uniref:Uncharacterized protein n=1 Tax=Plasmodium falciparum (isolate NF54) TaxID=5843 RepID=W7K0T0_PLAFO|nr:hypothetical protein PFNF54_04576 [Plasmodium falciparum NF54]